MALWRSGVRAPSGPLEQQIKDHQSEWYRGTPFVSEREGFLASWQTLEDFNDPQ